MNNKIVPVEVSYAPVRRFPMAKAVLAAAAIAMLWAFAPHIWLAVRAIFLVLWVISSWLVVPAAVLVYFKVWKNLK